MGYIVLFILLARMGFGCMNKLIKSAKTKSEELLSQYEKGLHKLGSEIRKEIIIPVCKKNKLEFLLEDGGWFFIDKDGDRIYHEFAYDTKLNLVLDPILELLITELTRSDYIGYYVKEVRKKDCQ